MQHLISFLWTKAKSSFPQKTEWLQVRSGGSWSQQPACSSPNFRRVTETRKEREHHEVGYAIWKGLCPRKLRMLMYLKWEQPLERRNHREWKGEAQTKAIGHFHVYRPSKASHAEAWPYIQYIVPTFIITTSHTPFPPLNYAWSPLEIVWVSTDLGPWSGLAQL